MEDSPQEQASQLPLSLRVIHAFANLTTALIVGASNTDGSASGKSPESDADFSARMEARFIESRLDIVERGHLLGLRVAIMGGDNGVYLEYRNALANFHSFRAIRSSNRAVDMVAAGGVLSGPKARLGEMKSRYHAKRAAHILGGLAMFDNLES